MKSITFIIVTLTMAAFISGCNSTFQKVTESIDAAGMPVKITESGSEAPLAKKSVNALDTAEVVQASVSEVSSTPFPNVTLGGYIKAIQTSRPVPKGETTAPQIQYVKKATAFGQFLSLFGLDVGTTVFTYTGVAGETADETAKRVDSVKKLCDVETKTQATEKKE